MTQLPFRDLRIGRWLGPTIDSSVSKAIGNALEPVGAAVVAGDPRPRTLKLTIPVHGGQYDADPVETAYRMRRQLEALLSNDEYRQFVYFAFAFDDTLDGWIALSTGDLSYDGQGAGGASMGEFRLELGDVYRLGERARNRDARRLDLASKLLVTTPRDYGLTIYSTDFAAAPGPVSAPAVILPPYTLDATRSNNRPQLINGQRRSLEGDLAIVLGDPFPPSSPVDPLVDGEVITYERNSSRVDRLADVVVYDRRVDANPANAAPIADVAEPFANLTKWTVVAGANLSGDPTGLKATANYATPRRLLHAAGNAYTDGVHAGVEFKTGAALAGFSLGLEFTNEDESRAISVTVTDDGIATHLLLTIDEDTAGTGGYNDNVTRLTVNTTYWFEVSIVANRIRTRLYISPDVDEAKVPVARDQVYDLEDEDGYLASTPRAPLDAAINRLATTPTHFALNWTPADAAARISALRVTALRDVQAAFGWEELYGVGQRPALAASYPINSTSDAHVIANGLCRVRYVDSLMSFAVDVYRRGLGWVEQGYLTPSIDSGVGLVIPFARSELVEWTPEFGAIRVTFADPNTTPNGRRLEVVISLARGDRGPSVELYPRSGGSNDPIGARIRWTPTDTGLGLRTYAMRDFAAAPAFVVDSDETSWGSIIPQTLAAGWQPGFVIAPKVSDTAGGKRIAPMCLIPFRAAGSTMLYTTGTPETTGGAAVPTGNSLTYQQPASAVAANGGYLGMKIVPVAREVMIDLTAAGGTAADVADGTASGGTAVQETQAAATNNSTALLTSSALGAASPTPAVLDEGGRYGVFLKVRVGTAGATVSARAYGGAAGTTQATDDATGATPITGATTSTTYTWVYVGALDMVHGFKLAGRVWRSAGAGNVFVDRALVVPLQRRFQLASGPRALDGVDDVTQAAMVIARAIPTVVDR